MISHNFKNCSVNGSTYLFMFPFGCYVKFRGQFRLQQQFHLWTSCWSALSFCILASLGVYLERRYVGLRRSLSSSCNNRTSFILASALVGLGARGVTGMTFGDGDGSVFQSFPVSAYFLMVRGVYGLGLVLFSSRYVRFPKRRSPRYMEKNESSYLMYFRVPGPWMLRIFIP